MKPGWAFRLSSASVCTIPYRVGFIWLLRGHLPTSRRIPNDPGPLLHTTLRETGCPSPAHCVKIDTVSSEVPSRDPDLSENERGQVRSHAQGYAKTEEELTPKCFWV